ncbi:hypothetical protein CYMTET_29346 [Cymbomonas tetramitiformis]|uniref:Sacsin/Nov domain-containing protein n=1 Tax=Cymbomonas tetramitiformis TaxID=36881 RepID=A0AAE0FL04_9CHLO|nr:hypothetical protein CYMTET_29346 [Cymbomonas tetramitiformis]
MLSDSLYSKESHFILELIQNAEDNQYEQGVEPTVKFVLSRRDPTNPSNTEGALYVFNNEVGFAEKNVRAICDIGNSTKKYEKSKGYIGEKGIGFKSVFVCSKTPYISSRDFHFYLSEEEDPEAGFGYIIPYWDKHCIASKNCPPGYQTSLLLPLKPGQRKMVRESLLSLAPETILFLTKLQGLEIELENAAGGSEMRTFALAKDENNANLVTLTTNCSVSYNAGALERRSEVRTDFWIGSKEFAVPFHVTEEKRAGIESRVVSVALPLKSSQPGHAEELCGRVFAFLPTEENSNLPFMVNADFFLTASRESVQCQHPWNEWLRDCIAPCLEENFLALLSQQGGSRQPNTMAYSFIPEHTAQPRFFQGVASDIYRRLARHKCVLSDVNTLELPSAVRIAPQKWLNLSIPGSVLHMAPELLEYRRRLGRLGVGPMKKVHFLQCLADVRFEQKVAKLRTPHQYFFELYEFLANYGRDLFDDDLFQKAELKQMKLLLCKGTAGPAPVIRQFQVGRPVFFPSEDVSSIQQKLGVDLEISTPICMLTKILYQKLCERPSLLSWVCENLEVQHLNVGSYALQISMECGDDVKDRKMLLELTAFISKKFAQFQDFEKQEVRANWPVVVSNGRPNDARVLHRRGKDLRLVLPEATCAEGWPLLFDRGERSGMHILADEYKCQDFDDEMRAYVLSFLRELGATAHPEKVQEKKEWSGTSFGWAPSSSSGGKEALDLSPTACAWLDSQPEQDIVGTDPNKKYFLTDFRAWRWLRAAKENPPAADDVAAVEALRRRGAALLAWLESKVKSKEGIGHNGYHLKLENAGLVFYWRPERGAGSKGQHKRMDRSFPSDFQHWLEAAPWVPTRAGGLARPRDCFADTQQASRALCSVAGSAYSVPDMHVLADSAGLGARLTARRTVRPPVPDWRAWRTVRPPCLHCAWRTVGLRTGIPRGGRWASVPDTWRTVRPPYLTGAWRTMRPPIAHDLHV